VSELASWQDTNRNRPTAALHINRARSIAASQANVLQLFFIF
jgi:hypothetical protein